MTMMDEKPSLEDLAHYGVKGMKWGVRRADRGGEGGSSKPVRAADENKRGFKKEYSSAEIRSARLRNQARRNEVGRREDMLNLTYAGGSKKQQDAAMKAYKKAEKDYLTNRDAAIQARMTKGEKVVTAILAGPSAPIFFGINKGAEVASEKIVNRERRKAGLST